MLEAPTTILNVGLGRGFFFSFSCTEVVPLHPQSVIS